MQAPTLLAAAALVAVLAGCTNPEYAYEAEGACPGRDTTAPVAGDECPLEDEEPENATVTPADKSTIEEG